LFLLYRPQEGFRKYRVTFSVMESRILWWMESSEDVFYPSPMKRNFPLVRQDDAPFTVLFHIPRPRFVRYHNVSGDSYDDIDVFCDACNYPSDSEDVYVAVTCK
jgi:hypothetical protein